MTIQTTQSTTGASSSSGTTPTNPMGELGKDDFLQMLVTQLKYQDPLNPTDNSQFMAQLAQFSMVEGINNVQSTLTSLQGVGLIGKQITYTKADGSYATGVATSVTMDKGALSVQVDGDDVDPSDIVGVSDPAQSGATEPDPTQTDPTQSDPTQSDPSAQSGADSTGASGA